jgi:hypothetical protein
VPAKAVVRATSVGCSAASYSIQPDAGRADNRPLPRMEIGCQSAHGMVGFLLQRAWPTIWVAPSAEEASQGAIFAVARDVSRA